MNINQSAFSSAASDVYKRQVLIPTLCCANISESIAGAILQPHPAPLEYCVNAIFVFCAVLVLIVEFIIDLTR